MFLAIQVLHFDLLLKLQLDKTETMSHAVSADEVVPGSLVQNYSQLVSCGSRPVVVLDKMVHPDV